MNCAVERNYNGSHNRWQMGQIQRNLGNRNLEEKCRRITLNMKEYIYDDRRIIKIPDGRFNLFHFIRLFCFMVLEADIII